MNRDQLNGNWQVVKGKIQKQWGRLTSDDLDVIEGNRKEIIGRIQARYGYAKDRAERKVDEWLTRFLKRRIGARITDGQELEPASRPLSFRIFSTVLSGRNIEAYHPCSGLASNAIAVAGKAVGDDLLTPQSETSTYIAQNLYLKLEIRKSKAIKW
jgi:uncharacterized protein YjbJ (UPF0337 family)